MTQYTATEVSEVQRQARRSTFAAMETGNFDRARTIITEVAEYLPEFAESLRQDVVESYNLSL